MQVVELRHRPARFVAVLALLSLAILIPSHSRAAAAASSVRCAAPITKWVYLPKSGESDNLVPGQTFDVGIPTTWEGDEVSVIFSDHDVIREECSDLGGTKPTILFKALAVGTSQLSLSIEGRPNSVRVGQINVDPAPPPTKWPEDFTAHVLRYDYASGYEEPVPFNTLVTGSTRNAVAKSTISLKGRYGYALASVNGFQYPARSVDGGKIWRVDGTWFAGPWADGAAFAGTMRTFSETTAAAAGDGQLLYTTTDAGKLWYQLFFTGVVLRVRSDGLKSFTVTLGTEDGVGAGRTYESEDGGVHWSRVSGSATVGSAS